MSRAGGSPPALVFFFRDANVFWVDLWHCRAEYRGTRSLPKAAEHEALTHVQTTKAD